MMNVALWIVQALLAVVFTTSGIAKSRMSKDALVASGQTGVRFYDISFIRFIAVMEILGVLGLILPGLLDIAAFLTPLAAAGLAVIMVGAATSHSRLVREGGARRAKEMLNVATNAVLFTACLFVVIGRFSWL
jgi:uncharacterized membrane protein YphA (DoxX/SURF4 family)